MVKIIIFIQTTEIDAIEKRFLQYFSSRCYTQGQTVCKSQFRYSRKSQFRYSG